MISWKIAYMYGMFVAMDNFDHTIWARTERELEELFDSAGYKLVKA